MAREKYAPPASEGLSADEVSTLQNIGERYTENETNGADSNYQTPGNHHVSEAAEVRKEEERSEE